MADNISSIPDVPCGADVNDFGTERYVDGLIKFIENSSAPITIALQGEWGSGKTSLMNRLKHSLCEGEQANFMGVEVNTWEYSMMTTPEATVLNIITHLVKSLSKDDISTQHTFNNFIKKAGNIIWRVGREAIKVTTPVAAIATEALVSNQIFDEDSDNAKDEVSVTDLKGALERSVAAQIETGKKKGVIVFVDDLDRLNPPVAVEILELLKNIFCIENCIFILAIDYEVVVKGLEPKFGKLTDQNEREFRSFFDKIIQVPFSLPVSSYRPMDFVLDSLVKIGYITDDEKGDDRIKTNFKEIVDKSVGKNPRSIKRLINTLSLLSCIDSCGQKDEESELLESYEGRVVNFAIVAIQVCYPKIYRMLTKSPDFRKWDSTFAKSLNIDIKTETEDDAHLIEWEVVLDSVCESDKYLKQHSNDIQTLLELIEKTLTKDNSNDDSMEAKIRSIIDKSSITGISEFEPVGEVDRKRLIYTLHADVDTCIQKKRPEINRIQYKRNTGNGGFFVYFPDDTWVEVAIRPRVKTDKIACEIWLRTRVERPQSLVGKNWEEMMQVPTVAKMISIMDNCVAPLLKDSPYFEGYTYQDSDLKTYFKSFSEEQKWLVDVEYNVDRICNDVSYYINLKKESSFRDPDIVGTIADLVIALYDFGLTAKQLSNE